MKSKIIVPILLVFLASIFVTQSVFAQSNQVTSTVSLSHLNVQLTFPSQVLPGQSATVNVTAQAKDSFQLISLTMQLYLADQNNLRQLLSTTVAQNTIMVSGNQINKAIQVTVPSDATRTSLVAQITESVGANPYPYNLYTYPSFNCIGTVCAIGSYPYYYYSSPSYSPYYSSSAPAYPYSYSSYQTYYQLQTNYQPSSDDAVAALSYVLAPTPEYVALQSQYQQLQTQNQLLRQQVEALQNSTAQKDSTISSLNNQLSSAQGTTTLLGIVAIVLAIAVVALAALHFKSTRTSDTELHSPSKTEEKTTGV